MASEIQTGQSAQPSLTAPGSSTARLEGLVARLRPYGFRWLFVLDAVALLAVMTGINLARFGTSWPTYSLAWYAVGFAAATAFHLLVFYFGGLYEHEQRVGQRPWLPRVASLTLIAVLFDALAALLSGRFLMPRFNLAILFVGATLVLTFNRRLSRRLRLYRGGRPRVLLVGPPDDIRTARTHLHDGDTGALLVGEIDSSDDLVERVHQCFATDVLLLAGSAVEGIYPEPLTTLERLGVVVHQRISARETLYGLREVREIAGMPFVTLHTHALPRSRAHFKRSLEMVMLVASLPVLLPVVALVALYVLTVAGRPILHRQVRTGRDGRPYRMVKFRTMYPNAEEGIGPVLASKGDPRIIPACDWLRRTRLDEIPNFWNVVKGEMSIVGPRPERPELTEQFEELIPGYNRRHDIPPGITGLAQVQGRYDTDPGYKLGHDLHYLVNWSPVRDLQIMVRTIWVVLRRQV
jgi:exopolysaccharide biosynthesis polyprenyl glycosylphosphotransferase